MANPFYITENDVNALLDMPTAISALETYFREQAAGQAKNAPRQRAHYWGGRLNMMSAGAASGRFAFKAYGSAGGGTVYHVMLYDVQKGLLAIIEAGRLGQLRTGAATGIAVDRMAPQSAATLGMIGAGRQARTQLQAIAAVRTLRQTKIFSRDAARAKAFCDAMSKELGIDVRPAASGEACVADADIVVAATTSSTPVILDAWLKPDAHVTGMGANSATRSELEVATYARASLIVTDDVDQARLEAGELIDLVASGKGDWSNIVELSQVVAGRLAPVPGKLSIFKSLGAAIEDLAAASAIYDRAVATGFHRRVAS